MQCNKNIQNRTFTTDRHPYYHTNKVKKRIKSNAIDSSRSSRKQSMYMRWVHKPYVSKWITLSSVISDPLLKNKWTVSKGIQGTQEHKIRQWILTWSTSADGPKQTYIRAIKRLIMRLIMQYYSHEYLFSRVGWWETILELLIWLDRIIHNAYQFYSYPPLIFPRKQIMQSRKISCNMTMREYAHWTMLTVMLDSCDHATATMRLLRTLLESHVD